VPELDPGKLASPHDGAFGGIALGSWTWGLVAERFSISQSASVRPTTHRGEDTWTATLNDDRPISSTPPPSAMANMVNAGWS
jgi:hypothetical protein